MEIRRLNLGIDCNMVCGKIEKPLEGFYADNNPIAFIEPCVGLRLNILPSKGDDREAIIIYLDKAQAKGIIKGLKVAMKGLR